MKKLLNPKMIILFASTIIAIFYWVVPPAQAWVSANVTLVRSWEEETKMSGSILIVLGILILGSYAYLIYDALKESDTERIEKKLDQLIGLIKSWKGEDNDDTNNKTKSE